MDLIPKEEIEIRKDRATIYIQSLDNKPIEKVRIWDFSGRLLFQTQAANFNYQIPTHSFSTGAIVVTVLKEGRWYRQKEMIR